MDPAQQQALMDMLGMVEKHGHEKVVANHPQTAAGLDDPLRQPIAAGIRQMMGSTVADQVPNPNQPQQAGPQNPMLDMIGGMIQQYMSWKPAGPTQLYGSGREAEELRKHALAEEERRRREEEELRRRVAESVQRGQATPEEDLDIQDPNLRGLGQRDATMNELLRKIGATD